MSDVYSCDRCGALVAQADPAARSWVQLGRVGVPRIGRRLALAADTSEVPDPLGGGRHYCSLVCAAVWLSDTVGHIGDDPLALNGRHPDAPRLRRLPPGQRTPGQPTPDQRSRDQRADVPRSDAAAGSRPGTTGTGSERPLAALPHPPRSAGGSAAPDGRDPGAGRGTSGLSSIAQRTGRQANLQDRAYAGLPASGRLRNFFRRMRTR